MLIQRFLHTVRSYPDLPAIELSGRSLSYRELFIKASAVAEKIDKDARKGQPLVFVLSDKSLENYIAILGVLLSGRGYVPLNPKFPVNRNSAILSSVGTDLLIHSPQSADYLITLLSVAEKNIHLMKIREDELFFLEDIRYTSRNPRDIAYLLFTSGTTGKPKGVAIEERSVDAYLDFIMKEYVLQPGHRFSQTFDLTFDLSVHDLFLCWSTGGCLVVPESSNPLHYYHYIIKNNITVWFSVPSTAVLFSGMRLLKPAVFPSLRYSFFCGEPLTESIFTLWKEAAPDSSLINLYGPTEATIAISRYEWRRGEPLKQKNGIVSIGKVFESQEFRIHEHFQDERQGELLLHGSQVITRYFNDSQSDERQFLTFNNEPDKRWYKTGDIVARDENRDLYYIGRIDEEVKISGYRVNLLEIDDLIRKFCNPVQVATICPGEGIKGKIISFLTLLPGSPVSSHQIISHCRENLPWYMVPEKIIFVDEMPLNENGKVDKKKLKQYYLG